MKVWYMAAPLAGDVPANLARAKRWLRWLVRAVPADVTLIAPWIAAVEVCGDDDSDPAVRELALQRDCAVVDLCDAVVLVGGRISPGMQREAEAARSVQDLTHLGPEPPGVCVACGHDKQVHRPGCETIVIHLWGPQLSCPCEAAT